MQYQKKLDAIATSLTLNGALNTRDWVAKQVRLGRLDKAWLDLIPKLRKVLEDVYPGNWDIYINLHFNSSDLNKSIVNPEWLEWEDRRSIIQDQVDEIESELDNPTEDQRWIDLDDLLQDHNAGEPDSIIYTNYGKIEIDFSPVIRFPDFTITNSKGAKQQIQDFFFKFDVVLGTNGFVFNILKGVRTTVSQLHFDNKYYHSHLSKAIPRMKFRGFCTGHGETLQLASMLNGDFDENVFKMFLLHLDTVAKWESLEGGPHFRMSGITKGNIDIPLSERRYTDLPYGVEDKLPKEFLIGMRDYHSASRINWIIVDNKPIIEDDDNFEEALKYLGDTIESRKLYPNYSLCYKNESGDYLIYNTPPTNLSGRITASTIKEKPPLPDEFIPFRGQKIHFVIIPDPSLEEIQKKRDEEKKKIEEEQSRRPIYINPLIKNHVKQQLEDAASYFIFRKSVTERLDPQGNNVPTNTRQDSLSMSIDF